MTMKQARRRYRARFSKIVEEQILGSDAVRKVRSWDEDRPSFRAWAKKTLRAERPHVGKLDRIAGGR